MLYNTKRLFFYFLSFNVVFVIFFSLFFYFGLPVYFYLILAVIQFSLNALFLNRKFFNPLFLITKEISAVLSDSEYKKIVYEKEDDFGLIAKFFNTVTKNLESVSQYLKEGSRMASELALASQIQKSILPSKIPTVPKFDIVAKTRPAEEVGGDSFDITEKDGVFYFYIGDVTGHGAPAGLVMMMVNTLFDVFLPVVSNTKELAIKINNELKNRVNASLFMTTSFFSWNPIQNKLLYTGAGHEHIIIYRADEAVVEVFPAGGIALAMAEDISEIVEEKVINIKPQDMMILYSDGITEAVNPVGELYGLERLKNVVVKNGYLANSLLLFEAIASDIQNFTKDSYQKDDMTLMVIRYLGDVNFESDRQENLLSTRWNEQ